MSDTANSDVPAVARLDRGVVGLLSIAAIGCFIAFGSLGLSGHDDGQMLAGCRRILDGQVPHRDFIYVRPAGTFLLHAPVLAMGGDWAILLSRLVFWAQVTAISLAWLLLLPRYTGLPWRAGEQAAAGLIGFMLTAWLQAQMPWNTLDAVFLASLGLLLHSTGPSRLRVFGFFLIGASVLCRQPFLAFVVAAIVLLAELKAPAIWLAAAAPSGLYVAWLASAGALADFAIQMNAHHDLVTAGFLAYWRNSDLFYGVRVGLAVGALLSAHRIAGARITPRTGGLLARAGSLLLLTFVLDEGVTLAYRREVFHLATCFRIFGALVGLLPFCLFPVLRQTSGRLALLVLALAWSVSISIGDNYPGLSSGVVAMTSLAVARALAQGSGVDVGLGSRPFRLLLTLIVIPCFLYGRYRWTYNQAAGWQMTAPLDGVVAGARGIRTDPQSLKIWQDLRRLEAAANGKPYCVLPDLPCNWIGPDRRNAIAADWPQSVELPTRELVRRVFEQDIMAHRGRLLVFAQKYDASSWYRRLTPPRPGRDPVGDLVRTSMKKTAETSYFEVYE